MKSAAEQVVNKALEGAEHKPVSPMLPIKCTMKNLKRMVSAAQGDVPDQVIQEEDGISYANWECVSVMEVTEMVNFANIFLYTGKAVIRIVKEGEEEAVAEPPRIIRV